jgi:hypothetical protein
MRLAKHLFRSLLVIALIAAAVPTLAQFVGPPIPLPTTLVLEKPSPDRRIAKRRMIQLGVRERTYDFILRDGYVDDPNGRFFWNDVWRSVQNSRPNFQVQGPEADTFARLRPGDVVTVTGMYTFSTRTLELSHVAPGPGPLGPKLEY